MVFTHPTFPRGNCGCFAGKFNILCWHFSVWQGISSEFLDRCSIMVPRVARVTRVTGVTKVNVVSAHMMCKNSLY